MALGLLGLLFAGTTRAQDAADATADDDVVAADLTLEELARQLGQALATIQRLEQRVAELEGGPLSADDELEAQLLQLIEPEPVDSSVRTVFPSAFNPEIGVFMDAVIQAGDSQEKLDGEGDRFSLRETEVDFRLPLAPFAEGVLITSFEDEGNGQFDSTIEEGYLGLALEGLLDVDTAATARVGRFRVPFGHDNQLHTHDLLQVDRPLAVTKQLGEEGLIGDGIEFTTPLFHSEAEDGLGQTTTLQLAVVNGDMFNGEEALLGELADDAGLDLDSDAPVFVVRASHFVELNELSDLELGASYLGHLGSRAVMTDAGNNIETTMHGVDATLRTRDDETGVGSWLFLGEYIQTDFDYGQANTPGFPSGDQTTRGAWLTAQRQTGPNTYVGMRYGHSDALGTQDEYEAFSPYISWYADEFLRIRLQGQHLEYNPTSGGDETVNLLYLQFTWNFGAHMGHPYWVNR